MEKDKSRSLPRTHFSEEINGRKQSVRLITSDGDVFEAVCKILKATLVSNSNVSWDYEFTKTSKLQGKLPQGCSCYEIKAVNEVVPDIHYYFVANDIFYKRVVSVFEIMDHDAEIKEVIQ